MPKKKRDRRTRKRLLGKVWQERRGMQGFRPPLVGHDGWWHLFGGEVPDMATDDNGDTGPAWGQLVLGPSAFGPDSPGPDGADDAGTPIRDKVIPGHNGAPMTWRGSWTHYPSTAEVDEVTPPEYRTSWGARTVPIQYEGGHDDGDA